MNDIAVVDKNPIPVQTANNNLQPPGSLSKEAPSSPEIKPELVGSEREHENIEELKEMGVRVENNDRPNLSAEHKELGMDYAGATVPTPTFFSDKVQLPEIPKTGSSDDSKTALRMLIEKIMAWKLINK